MQKNRTLEHCMFIYLHLYMFQLFYSVTIRQKCTYIIRKACYAKGLSFTISMRKYMN